jgi:hypothetical protein
MDPLLSLAFSIQSNKGVYALLLGSGVSRSAKIPTGWEIVLELIRKLAVLSDENCEPSPETWFTQKFGYAPDYSDLLDMVAKTQTERQQLLKAYFEPTVEDQDENAKQPTKAHHAIARLVLDGFIKVIITTNFDQLTELALKEAGIAPYVLSTPDQIEGALPLVHTHCCVIKVHGDHLDTRIKNTPAELENYDLRINNLLDQIFDQFGLVICGWSADWDIALRSAIERTVSRRFSTYWASKGQPSEKAKTLIQLRAGQLISVADADSFFTTLQEKVEALQRFSEPHPLSVQTAVASTKKYLAEHRYRIHLYDLVNGEVIRAIGKLSSPDLTNLHIPASSESLTERVRKYEAACNSLVAMAATCGQWGDPKTAEVWQIAQQRLYTITNSEGYQQLIDFQRYPITLITYAACMGATLSKNFEFISSLVCTQLKKEYNTEQKAIDIVPPFLMLRSWESAKLLEGMDQRHAPLNDWLHDTLLVNLGEQFSSNHAFSLSFDKVEILFALANNKHRTNPLERSANWFPPGCYGYRYANLNSIVNEITDSINTFEEKSPYVACGLIGDSANQCREQLQEFSSFVSRLNWN